MNPWEEIKVGDLGRIVTGKTPKTAEKDNYDGNIMFVTPSDNMDAKYIVSTGKRLTEKGKCSVKGAIIPAGSVCVSCIGSDLGKVVITTEECVTNQQINSIVVNTNKYDIDFVYYSMLVLGKELNFHSKTSTAVPIVNKSSFSTFSIRCPSLETQKRIAGILSSIDNKIITNESINQNLSLQIQTIYDNLVGEIDTIPVEISSVIEVRDGTHDSPTAQEAGFPLVTSKHLLPYGVDLVSPNKISKDDYDKINERSKVETNDILLSMIGTVGLISLVIDNPVEFAIKNVGLFKTSANPEFYPFVLAYLRSNKTAQHIDKVLAGSTQKYISLGELRKMPIALPNNEQLNSFNAIVKPIISQIINVINENNNLTRIRDTLLPRLMSGELDVSEIDI